MKTIKYLFTILFLIFGLYGCSDERPYKPENKEIFLWAGQISIVNIETELPNDNYILISEDQDIATAVFDKQPNRVCITTYKNGSTIIRIIDQYKKKTVCEIRVSARYFYSPEIIDCGIPLNDNSDYMGVIIKLGREDEQLIKDIDYEIREKGKQFIGAVYTFNKDTRRFTMDTDSGIYYEGTYEWDISSLTLTCNEKKEKYTFKFATGIRDKYIIQSDKTKEYQQKYPNSDIKSVIVNRVWKDNGIIQIGGIVK